MSQFTGWEFRDTIDTVSTKEVYKLITATFINPVELNIQNEIIQYLKDDDRYHLIHLENIRLIDTIEYIKINKVTVCDKVIDVLKEKTHNVDCKLTIQNLMKYHKISNMNRIKINSIL